MEALGIDPKLLIAQIVNFVIFYLIFRKFIAGPLLRYLKKQQEEEAKRVSLTRELELAKSSLDEERKKMRADVQQEQKNALREAKRYADTIKQDMLAQSKQQADKIIEDGKVALEREREDARREIAQYVRDTAELAVRKGLASYLNDDARKAITDHVIKHIH